RQLIRAMWYICFFFFFQAEDGIRDWSVTGVQTCALPISTRRSPTRGGRGWRDPTPISPPRDRRVGARWPRWSDTGTAPRDRGIRSEERRVGKEWKCRWSQDDVKKKGEEYGVKREMSQGCD